MTHTEFDTLKTKLAGMPPEALAAFITELAVTSERVREAVALFIERENPSKLTSALRKQLRVLERNEHFYHYREAQTLVRRLDDWLDRIEQDLLPKNPKAAIELLSLFFQADAAIYEHVDDSDGGVGMCYRRAAEIMSSASIQAGRPPLAGHWMEQLMQANDYGVRDFLFDQAGAFLSPDAIRARIKTWRAQLKGAADSDSFDYKRHSLHTRCAQFAKAIPDPELYAEIRLQGQDVNASPLFALDVAELFLETGHPERARDFLPNSSQGHWSERTDELKIRIHEALGEHANARDIRWQQFLLYPSKHTARKYLNYLPEHDQAHALPRMRRIVDAGDYSWRIKTSYYLDDGDHEAAAAMIETHYGDVLQADYYTQSEMADILADTKPLAASLLLRGAAEQTVAQSKSKYYKYAVRYIQKLEALADRFQHWGDCPSHQDWWATFMEQHRRKSALIDKLKKAGTDLP